MLTPNEAVALPLEERWYRVACAWAAMYIAYRPGAKGEGGDADDVAARIGLTRLRDELAEKSGMPLADLYAAEDDAAETMPVLCAYCAWEGTAPKDDLLPTLHAHVLVCPDHPMRAVEAERDRLRRILAEVAT